jgi:hypothetical protein
MTSLLISLTLAVAAPVPKAEREFREKVDAARDKAIKYLKDQQDKDGSWESLVLANVGDMKGGVTALAALALLEAGVPANDPAVAKAVEYLLPLQPERTYVVSLQTQVLARTKDIKHLPQIQKLADWLVEKRITKDGKLQGWSYPANAIADNSNTHFAVMGLHTAAQAGAKVDAEIWQQIRDYYARTQQADGGWTYTNAGSPKSTASMTTAALLGLAVAVKYDKRAKGPDAAFDKGLEAILGDKLQNGKMTAYDLFTTAELGRALGTTEFKVGNLTKAWYREGAEKVMKAQQADGSLKLAEKDIGPDLPTITTACGLYFLGPPAKK